MPIRGSPNGGPLNPVHAFPQAIPWWTSSLGIGGRHQSVRVDVINRFCWSPSLGTPRRDNEISIRAREWVGHHCNRTVLAASDATDEFCYFAVLRTDRYSTLFVATLFQHSERISECRHIDLRPRIAGISSKNRSDAPHPLCPRAAIQLQPRYPAFQ